MFYCLSLCSTLFAAQTYLHPTTDKDKITKSVNYPGFCQIEVINKSADDVIVSGVYDNGAPLYPFNIYSSDFPRYINMYYYGACHSSIYINVDTFSGYRKFSGYVFTSTTLWLDSRLNGELKAEIKK
jgi:hypothetical protein